jgi:hypothetical protein
MAADVDRGAAGSAGVTGADGDAADFTLYALAVLILTIEAGRGNALLASYEDHGQLVLTRDGIDLATIGFVVTRIHHDEGNGP